MKYITHLLLILSCGCFVGCDSRVESKSRFESEKAYKVAESRLLTNYQSSDVNIAKKALIDYRQIVIDTKGFNGYVNVSKALYLSDARLMMLCQLTGATNEAAQWYSSYLSNLNKVRTSEGQDYYKPSIDEVVRTFTKLDNTMDVKWRAVLEHGKN